MYVCTHSMKYDTGMLHVDRLGLALSGNKQELCNNNRNINTWMLHQIAMKSDKVMIAAG